MDTLFTLYRQRLNLQDATFIRIEHVDATVAIVYRVILHCKKQCILKICTRPKDYANELCFLKYFENLLPVPKIIQTVEPELSIYGAILMEYLPGALISPANFTENLAFEAGSLLARVHINRVPGYGDLTQPQTLSTNPQSYFYTKFKEGLSECDNYLPQELLEQCLQYFDMHLDLLLAVDGPCIVHRDFRAGNLIVCNDKIQGIIDWSAARASFAEEDLCFLEHGSWPINHITKESFLTGYASIRLIPNYNAIMPLLRLNRAIAVLGFTFKRESWKNELSYLYKYNLRYLDTLFKKTK